MTTSTLSPQTLECIDRYLNMTIGSATTPVLYFNNKTTGRRGALAVHVGKGTPDDISQEVITILFKKKIPVDTLTSESLRMIMSEHHIGIDCSGFVYQTLNVESISRGQGSLRTHLSFKNRGLLGSLSARMHPEKNASVIVFADDTNSLPVTLADVLPGDLIVMIGTSQAADRDHILLIHRIDYDESSRPSRLHYSHSVAHPEDGLYGTGVRQGTIDLSPLHSSLLDASWQENGLTGDTNRTLLKARSSQTSIRRIHWK